MEIEQEYQEKDDEISLSTAEVLSITKAGENHLLFRTSKDPEVSDGSFSAYSLLIASKIKDKFGLLVRVKNGQKFTSKKAIIFMKCQHEEPVNVSIPLHQFVTNRPMIFKVKLVKRCEKCPDSKT